MATEHRDFVSATEAGDRQSAPAIMDENDVKRADSPLFVTGGDVMAEANANSKLIGH